MFEKRIFIIILFYRSIIVRTMVRHPSDNNLVSTGRSPNPGGIGVADRDALPNKNLERAKTNTNTKASQRISTSPIKMAASHPASSSKNLAETGPDRSQDYQRETSIRPIAKQGDSTGSCDQLLSMSTSNNRSTGSCDQLLSMSTSNTKSTGSCDQLLSMSTTSANTRSTESSFKSTESSFKSTDIREPYLPGKSISDKKLERVSEHKPDKAIIIDEPKKSNCKQENTQQTMVNQLESDRQRHTSSSLEIEEVNDTNPNKMENSNEKLKPILEHNKGNLGKISKPILVENPENEANNKGKNKIEITNIPEENVKKSEKGSSQKTLNIFMYSTGSLIVILVICIIIVWRLQSSK